MRIIVVGAGIGGLATALSLDAAGTEVVVVDAVERPRPLGVGINLQPHAVRELEELGLGRGLERTGIPTAEVVHFDRHGNRIWSEPRGCGLGYRWPQYSIHRGELQMMLAEAVRERTGPVSLRWGARLDRFEESSAGVRAWITDRRTGRMSTIDGDALVGADGIGSTVRAQLHPRQPPLHFDGIRMWRGVTEAPPFLTGRSMAIAGSNSVAKFVAYPISKEAEDRGRALVNWVAEVRLPADAGAMSPDWTRAGRVEDVLPHFARWSFDWLDVPDLITRADAVLDYPMVDRDPLPNWGTDRVSLLGDAAHPMYPIGSNGGSQAIIDARVLAFALATTGDPVNGLNAYETERRDSTNTLVLANRANPADRVLRTVADRAPDGFRHVEDVLSVGELTAIKDAYHRTTNVDVHTLNTRDTWGMTVGGA